MHPSFDQAVNDGEGNIADFAISQLAGQSHGHPEVQLEEVLTALVDADKWEDFTESRLQTLFQGLARRFH